MGGGAKQPGWWLTPGGPAKAPFVGKAPQPRIRILRLIQANLAQYIGEEMQLVDVTNQDQGCYMEVLTEDHAKA